MHKVDKKQNFLKEFEEKLLDKRPSLSGKIKWDTPSHHFYAGYSTDEAVERYISLDNEGVFDK